MDLKNDIERWIEEKPLYEQLASDTYLFLEKIFFDTGISVKIERRVKNQDSLIKKLVQKHKKDSSYSYDDITDKCGIRIICRFKEDIPEIDRLIDENFQTLKSEDFYNELQFYEQGYKSIHKDVKWKKDNIPKDCSNQYFDFIIEIQIRTLCDNVWANIYHDIGYKPENMVSDKIKRELHCLGGLLETADNCFSLINNSIRGSTELSIEFVLNYLEKPFLQIFRSRYDVEYSKENIQFLLKLLQVATIEEFKLIIDGFINQKKRKLYQIAEERRNEIANPLITQPEIFIIFYLIETDRYTLKDRWEENFDIYYLNQLSIWWGKPIV